MGALKARAIGALNSAPKVKQFINATKSKNKVNIIQRLFTTRAASNEKGHAQKPKQALNFKTIFKLVLTGFEPVKTGLDQRKYLFKNIVFF